MNESELIRSAQLGDRDAFAGLVSSHEKKLLALCWNMLGEREEARDAAQDTLLQAFQNLVRFEPERSFVKWLLGIGAKRCLDRLRRRRMFLRYFQDHAGEWLGQEGPRPEAAAEKECAPRLLQKLSENERATVSLAVFEGLSTREVASALGCSENTVRVHLFNARVKLKKEVAHGL
jgi:RNA polymerase sigma-70 factor (ECF subfamily)